MIMKAAKSTQEFKALELKFNEDSSNPHTVYFKEHSVREYTADKPSGRTLFVINIPPYADEKGIQNAFNKAGDITSVIFSDKPGLTEEKPETFIKERPKPTFKVAYIIFSKESELQKALKLNYLQPLNCEEHTVKTGLSKWKDDYNKQIVNPKVLNSRVKVFMKKYDEKMKLIEEKEKGLEQEDDEGWVTVTKKGKVQSFARSEKVENKIMAKEAKGKKRKELKNFYTFQIRESKMKHIVALRQKFEEDKKKIAQIKQTRRFKPF